MKGSCQRFELSQDGGCRDFGEMVVSHGRQPRWHVHTLSLFISSVVPSSTSDARFHPWKLMHCCGCPNAFPSENPKGNERGKEGTFTKNPVCKGGLGISL